jgi:C_GCAxxG_C_C family probable redox protein
MINMENVIKKSAGYFSSGYGCAESVLMAYADYKDISSDLIPRIATGLCGGLAWTNGMCGAVSGAVLALNIEYGRENPDESKDKNYQAVQMFLNQFTEIFGDIGCPVLTGCDLSTTEGRDRFENDGIHEKCNLYVEEATRIVIDLI